MKGLSPMKGLAMMRGWLVLAAGCGVAGSMWAQGVADLAARGEERFAQTCSSGYCHGDRGVGGGAPRLVGRGFTQGFINTTVRNGIAGTGMPAFGNNLAAADLTAIVAYVASLNGIAGAAAGGQDAGPEAAALSGEAARGEALFRDAVRGFGRCSTCHQVGRIGIPVATPIVNVPENAAALKGLQTARVATATVAGQTMPALVVAQKSDGVQFYDLTSAPPVLRSELPAGVQIGEGSAWRHSSVIGAYSDAELGAVLGYLRAVVAE